MLRPVVSSTFRALPQGRSAAVTLGSRAVVQQQNMALASNMVRMFCAGQGSIEERVIKAVGRYANMRMEELKNESDTDAKIIEALGKDVSATTTWEDLGFDDLDKVEVLLEVEDEFNHVIPDDDSDAIQSVKDSVAYLQKHVSASGY